MSQAEDPRRLQRKERAGEVTVEDVRQLMGASTPHFALQLRNRIAKLIAGLPAGPPGARRRRARDRAPGAARPQPARCAASGAAEGERPLPSLRRSPRADAEPAERRR